MANSLLVEFILNCGNKPVSQYYQMKMCLNALIPLIIDRTDVKIGFQYTKGISYHTNYIIKLPHIFFLAKLLFNQLSLGTGRKSTIITTNPGFDRREEIFGDLVLTTALVDRLTHKAYLIDMIIVAYFCDRFYDIPLRKWLTKKFMPSRSK
jgi:hypothetical protein